MDALTAPPEAGRLAFTCLVPVYGRDDPDHFIEAMTSIAASTIKPTEVLIAQDGDLPAPLARVVDACVVAGARVARNPGSRGLQHNLNSALREVCTPWVARFDADDINAPERFALQTRFIDENPGIDAVGGAIVEFWPDGRQRTKSLPLTHDAIVSWAAWRNPINHMTAFYRLGAVLDAGSYPDLVMKEDYGLWLAMIGRGRVFANLPQPLVLARLGSDFHTRRAGRRNLVSEAGLFRIKRGIRRIGWARAWLAMVLRMGALTATGPARLVYERVLRR